MSLERPTRSNGRDTAEVLADLTGRPVEDFEYDGQIPDIEDLEFHLVEDADEE
ncbi:hypothetical protein [Saliphagus infecundisoli]|uniref:Uncharacterized protein n=1 Tax=Saliphagus infecundisoli TaxID=1849069 RepID=A0ABD5QL03_9EURY|nr:hypothetical protein [Saliphagus infecundisoli]